MREEERMGDENRRPVRVLGISGSPHRQGKRLGAFLSTAGQDWDYVFDALKPVVKCFFHVMDIKNRDISYLMVNSVDKKGELAVHPTAIADAKTLGTQMVKEIKKRLAEEGK